MQGLCGLIDLQDKTLDLVNINLEIATNPYRYHTNGTSIFTAFDNQKIGLRSSMFHRVSHSWLILLHPFTVLQKQGFAPTHKQLRMQLEDTNVKVFEVIPPGG